MQIDVEQTDRAKYFDGETVGVMPKTTNKTQAVNQRFILCTYHILGFAKQLFGFRHEET
jgi:hypothetical protein